MERVKSEVLNILERRLSTLRHLAKSLQDCQKVIVDLDLEGIHRQVARQENLCSELRFLGQEHQAATRDRAGGVRVVAPAAGEIQVSAYEQEALHRLRHELKGVLVQVRHLNRVQCQVLGKSRRSVNVLINFLAHYRGTYTQVMGSGTHFAVGTQGR